jgi:hypothetical protein
MPHPIATAVSTRRFRRLTTTLGLAAAGLGLLGLAPGRVDAAAVADRQVRTDDAGSERFLRFRKTPDGGYLETSIVTYRNAGGDTVDLIGAVHVGDEAYYDLLNERFATYDKLLYEMVKPRGTDMAAPRRPAAGGGGGDVPFAMRLIGGLQKAMQLALELEYQTQAIDYAPANFVHADLDLETFLRLQAEQGEGFLQLMIQQMLDQMLNPTPRDQPQVSMFEIMDAMNAPDRARRLKLLFARELSNMEDMMGAFDAGDDGSVILDVRNEKAIEVMDRELEKGFDNLGIFYGAAHLPGMDELLRERGFEPVGEPEYLIAWDMTIDGSGRRDMQARTRSAIIANEAADAGVKADDGDAGNLVAALREELDALRRENQALRRQLEAVREQNEALRERAEANE